MSEDDTRILFLRHVYMGWIKKIDRSIKERERETHTGVVPRRSDRICCIAGPHRRSRSLILIRWLLLWPTIYRLRRFQPGLWPTCITRYLISPVSTIVTGVDPDTPPSTNCGMAPLRRVLVFRLRASNWLAIRDKIAGRNILRSARARGGVTRSSRRKVADDPRYMAVLTRNP